MGNNNIEIQLFDPLQGDIMKKEFYLSVTILLMIVAFVAISLYKNISDNEIDPLTYSSVNSCIERYPSLKPIVEKALKSKNNISKYEYEDIQKECSKLERKDLKNRVDNYNEKHKKVNKDKLKDLIK